jgi:hypothetical protein
MKNAKKYKVTVERTHTVRTFYEITAPSDNCEEFHAKMHACMDGQVAPSDNFSQETGMRKGAVLFEDMSGEFYADEAAEEEAPQLELDEDQDTQLAQDELADEFPESFHKDIDDKMSLHVCPESGIPFLGDEENQVPIIPFETVASVGERDARLESGLWEEEDNIVYMSWLCLWTNLDRLNMQPDVVKYWTDIVEAVRNDEVREHLRSED